MSVRFFPFIFTVFFAILSDGSAKAFDGLLLSGGPAVPDTEGNRIGAALIWDWDVHWLEVADWYLTGYFDLGFSFWDQNEIPGDNESVWEVGVTPVLRLTTSRVFARLQPFLDIGVGAHYLSDDEYGFHDFGHHAFSPRAGLGFLNGPFEFGYHFQHYSNAGTDSDNDSIEFHVFFAGYRFQ